MRRIHLKEKVKSWALGKGGFSSRPPNWGLKSSDEGSPPPPTLDDGRDTPVWEGRRVESWEGVRTDQAAPQTRVQGKLGGLPAWLTVSGHAQCQALLQAAVLASVSAGAVDGAVLLAGAGVGHVTVLAPAEETLGKAGGDRAAGLASPPALAPVLPDPAVSLLLHFLAQLQFVLQSLPQLKTRPRCVQGPPGKAPS